MFWLWRVMMDEILDNTQFNAFVKEIKQKIYSAK